MIASSRWRKQLHHIHWCGEGSRQELGAPGSVPGTMGPGVPWLTLWVRGRRTGLAGLLAGTMEQVQMPSLLAGRVTCPLSIMYNCAFCSTALGLYDMWSTD
jgi:hypothetical protein